MSKELVQYNDTRDFNCLKGFLISLGIALVVGVAIGIWLQSNKVQYIYAGKGAHVDASTHNHVSYNSS